MYLLRIIATHPFLNHLIALYINQLQQYQLARFKSQGLLPPSSSQDLVEIDKTRLKNLVEIDKTTQKNLVEIDKTLFFHPRSANIPTDSPQILFALANIFC
jgi:hypothetical protein